MACSSNHISRPKDDRVGVAGTLCTKAGSELDVQLITLRQTGGHDDYFTGLCPSELVLISPFPQPSYIPACWVRGLGQGLGSMKPTQEKMQQVSSPSAEQKNVPNPNVNPWSCDAQEHYRRHGVCGSSSTFVSPRGLHLFTRTFEPAHVPPSACICMIHGYTNDISWTFQNTAIRFAALGYTAFAMDIEGHGFSQGLKGFVPNIDLVAEDFFAFFVAQKQDPRYKNLPFFLFGESLGGGICLLIHLAHPQDFDGVILLSPMCKISDTIKPPWPLPHLLTFFSMLAPTWGVVPTKELRPLSFKDPSKLELSLQNPNRYAGKPRLGTARELMRVTSYLGQRLHEVSLPFIVMHGGGDVVTDPAVSKALFETAKSTDKTLKLYDGMWHALLAGEYDADVDTIFADIQNWLKERVAKKVQEGQNGCDGEIAKNGVSVQDVAH